MFLEEQPKLVDRKVIVEASWALDGKMSQILKEVSQEHPLYFTSAIIFGVQILPFALHWGSCTTIHAMKEKVNRDLEVLPCA